MEKKRNKSKYIKCLLLLYKNFYVKMREKKINFEIKKKKKTNYINLNDT